MSGCSTPHLVTVRHLVIVGSEDPSTTDELAAVLRDTCTVRTAYSTPEVLDRLEPDVDVVLVDPGLGEDSVETVRDAVAGRELDCQFGVLSTGTDDRTDDDIQVSVAASERDFREQVEQLATRARYRKTLEEYYELVQASAELRAEDLPAQRDQVQRRLEALGRRLDDAAAPLDAEALFRAVLDDG